MAEAADSCDVRRAIPPHTRERGLYAVVALTAVMMVVEIAVGYATGSMALTADGFHMATHVGALGMAALAYALARRFAQHRAFAFGTGKVQALAGFTSALLLAVVALSMVYESTTRLLEPTTIDFVSSLPVAVVGLFVNLLSVWLLHGDEHAAQAHDHHAHEQHRHDHHDHAPHQHGHRDHDRHGHGHHDHNHRAAVLHVIADALTSALAIVALLSGKWLGITWLDPVTGLVGGAVILKWSYSLCAHASRELLDFEPGAELEQAVRAALEQERDVRVLDLHVWSVGAGRRCCIATLSAGQPRAVEYYRGRVLSVAPHCHLTIEVRQGA